MARRDGRRQPRIERHGRPVCSSPLAALSFVAQAVGREAAADRARRRSAAYSARRMTMARKRKKLTPAERAEMEAHSRRVLENARRLRELAEQGFARLTPAEQARVRELVPRLRDAE
jgi:hypothetical protein